MKIPLGKFSHSFTVLLDKDAPWSCVKGDRPEYQPDVNWIKTMKYVEKGWNSFSLPVNPSIVEKIKIIA